MTSASQGGPNLLAYTCDGITRRTAALHRTLKVSPSRHGMSTCLNILEVIVSPGFGSPGPALKHSSLSSDNASAVESARRCATPEDPLVIPRGRAQLLT